MTTIAISDGVVAADTQLTDGNHVLRVRKLYRLPDGGVVTGCGDWKSAFAGIRWIVEGQRGDAPDLGEASVVIVRPDKTVWVAEGQFPAYPLVGTEYVAGCGADLVRLLMAKGASPGEAVAEACEHDALSSAPIHLMTVYPPRGEGLEIFDVTKRKRGKGRT